MNENPQSIFPEPRFEIWRYLALGACLFAMFWPTIRAIVLWAGSDALFSYPNPYPSVWVAAFVFGALVGRMEAIYVGVGRDCGRDRCLSRPKHGGHRGIH